MHSFNRYNCYQGGADSMERAPVPLLSYSCIHCPLAKPFFQWPCGSCSVKKQGKEILCFEDFLNPSRQPATQGWHHDKGFFLPSTCKKAQAH